MRKDFLFSCPIDKWYRQLRKPAVTLVCFQPCKLHLGGPWSTLHQNCNGSAQCQWKKQRPCFSALSKLHSTAHTFLTLFP
jgi:hypothetical protein